MTSSIKISDEAKAKLEEFIAMLRVKKKLKITQQDLLTKIIFETLSNEEQIIEKILGDKPTSEEDPLWNDIHNPVKVTNPPKKEDLDKLEEDLWQK